ncbi:hypothetical protein F383_18047 [Gossypium arboreum]|uniref:Uncharacterized protein n=1 Tax=Gossypium arboreum TaxID=29729 RepID=A0A0B0MM29_GOSAR|nr:hypothetical protein F383_18047 [Gossypium arboreum]
MSGTCIGHIMRDSSVRPAWDMALASINESQCKTCLGHGIDFDMLANYSKRFNERFMVYIKIRELMTMCVTKVACGSSPYVGEASHTILEAIGIASFIILIMACIGTSLL